ncbi:MAG: hypothetical protein AAGI01_07125 [Myxococcota bacterium]
MTMIDRLTLRPLAFLTLAALSGCTILDAALDPAATEMDMSTVTDDGTVITGCAFDDDCPLGEPRCISGTCRPLCTFQMDRFLAQSSAACSDPTLRCVPAQADPSGVGGVCEPRFEERLLCDSFSDNADLFCERMAQKLGTTCDATGTCTPETNQRYALIVDVSDKVVNNGELTDDACPDGSDTEDAAGADLIGVTLRRVFPGPTPANTHRTIGYGKLVASTFGTSPPGSPLHVGNHLNGSASSFLASFADGEDPDAGACPPQNEQSTVFDRNAVLSLGCGGFALFEFVSAGGTVLESINVMPPDSGGNSDFIRVHEVAENCTDGQPSDSKADSLAASDRYQVFLCDPDMAMAAMLNDPEANVDQLKALCTKALRTDQTNVTFSEPSRNLLDFQAR